MKTTTYLYNCGWDGAEAAKEMNIPLFILKQDIKTAGLDTLVAVSKLLNKNVEDVIKDTGFIDWRTNLPLDLQEDLRLVDQAIIEADPEEYGRPGYDGPFYYVEEKTGNAGLEPISSIEAALDFIKGRKDFVAGYWIDGEAFQLDDEITNTFYREMK